MQDSRPDPKASLEIARLLKVSAEPEYAGARAGDVKHSLADLHRAETLLGYKPKTDINAGLKRVVAWWSRGG